MDCVNNNKEEILLNKNIDNQDQNLDKKDISSKKKIFPKENNMIEDEDIRVFNIFDPESGKYVKKYVKKIRK